MSRLAIGLVLILIAIGIAAAVLLVPRLGGGDNDVPFAQNEQARIECNETCAVHGFCGTLLDNQRAVLANQQGPSVSLYDRLFIEGATVIIVDPNQRELIAARGGAPLIGQATPFPHFFYQVEGEGKIAWVSEWCLARP